MATSDVEKIEGLEFPDELQGIIEVVRFDEPDCYWVTLQPQLPMQSSLLLTATSSIEEVNLELALLKRLHNSGRLVIL